MNIKIPTKIARKLVANSKITAGLMYDWNRNNNPQCKFLPGDAVIVKNKNNYNESAIKRKLNKTTGRVIAVSTVDGIRMNNRTRHWTRYYIADDSGRVNGLYSFSLIKT